MENHIEIAKEDIRAIEYAFRPFVGAPKPPQRDRYGHGGTLKTELSNTVSSIESNRQEVGIDAENLLVLQLMSAEAVLDVDILQNKLHLALVEEVKNADGTMRYVVQFASKDDIAVFEHERALWESDNPNGSNVLTYAQRRDLFACIESIRPLSPEDRTGKRLSEAINGDTLPDGLFIVDIDVWFDGDLARRNNIERQIKMALGTGDSTLLGDLFVLPNLLLGRAKVNRFTLEVLRKLDLIAQVDFPIGVIATEQCELYSADFVPAVNNMLDENAPLACVIDSGIFSGNSLLSKIIVAEEDFDLTEETTSDFNGHGTGVAGIVAYGDLTDYDKENRVFNPLVRLCNGKVMHNDSTWNTPVFDESKRPEELVASAIRYFHENNNCRVFNLSAGFESRIYNGGRQMAWASLLDALSRELDVVIIVSAGNVPSPDVPVFTGREDLMENTRNQLLSEEHRLIDPA
ncbi:MAG: S8 family serine peptidase, partial [Spirochaetales bacterium]|nr:S8 family serine peptidase [Spirochaetales bacterium]